MKRRIRKTGNFFLALLVNLLLHLEETVPAWILLACHRWLGWSIRWFWIALGIWLVTILLRMDFLRWARRCSAEKDPPKENKNPYSAGVNHMIKKS